METMEKMDLDAYKGRHYKVAGYPPVAWYVAGREVEIEQEDYIICDEEDCDHLGSELCWIINEREVFTGNLLMVMVGDDRRHVIDPCDLIEISDEDYCLSCGQIGCGH